MEQSCQSDKRCCLSKVSSHNDSFGERAARAGSSSHTPDRNSISHTNLSLSLSVIILFFLLSLSLLSFSFSHVGPRNRKSILWKTFPHSEACASRDGLWHVGVSGTQPAFQWRGSKANAGVERLLGDGIEKFQKAPFSKLAPPVTVTPPAVLSLQVCPVGTSVFRRRKHSTGKPEKARSTTHTKTGQTGQWGPYRQTYGSSSLAQGSFFPFFSFSFCLFFFREGEGQSGEGAAAEGERES